MPFAVFRRHQKKMLAFLAIFAMVAFTLDFSLFRNDGGGGQEDSVVVALKGQTIRRSDLAAMSLQRGRANAFLARLDPRIGAQPLGGTSTRELVDALILKGEADRLGLPASAEYANRWLNRIFGGALRPDLFERVRKETFSDLTGEQLLEVIAGQVRLLDVRSLPGAPMVTPLDVYQAYRDQNEKVSAIAVPFRVADYLKQAPEPGDAEVRADYEKYKDAYPDRLRDTPGFKFPQRAQVEFVAVDGDALARDIKAKLTEAELRQAFKDRPKDFAPPPAELPADVFAGEEGEKLRLEADRFPEMRSLIETTLAEERAKERIDRQFDELKAQALEPFTDRYQQVVDENSESAAKKSLPEPGDLFKAAAAKAGMADFTKTPLLDRDEATRFGTIGEARASGGKGFAEFFLDPRAPLYEPIDLSDIRGRRYLAWKVQDLPPRVPPLEEVRDRVVAAWKTEKARALAEADAKALAKKAEAQGGDLRKAADAEKRSLVTTDPVPRQLASVMMGPTMLVPSRPSEIAQVPDAGDAFREALFGLGPKEVAVAPDAPKTTYYALALALRSPADFDALYDPFGPRMSLQPEVLQEAQRRQEDAWMASLRARAGLPADWAPADEKDEAAAG
jgi:hypothetical protein